MSQAPPFPRRAPEGWALLAVVLYAAALWWLSQRRLQPPPASEAIVGQALAE